MPSSTVGPLLGFHVGFRFGDRQRQRAGQPRHFSHTAPLGCLAAILNSQVISWKKNVKKRSCQVLSHQKTTQYLSWYTVYYNVLYILYIYTCHDNTRCWDHDSRVSMGMATWEKPAPVNCEAPSNLIQFGGWVWAAADIVTIEYTNVAWFKGNGNHSAHPRKHPSRPNLPWRTSWRTPGDVMSRGQAQGSMDTVAWPSPIVPSKPTQPKSHGKCTPFTHIHPNFTRFHHHFTIIP